MTCTVKACGKPHRARGLCTAHYKRWRRHGSPTSGGPFRGETVAFLEMAKLYRGDECLLWPFAKTKAGYGNFAAHRTPTTVHPIVCEALHGGRPSPRHEAAHICGVRLCCNPTHLRWATRRENAADMISHGTLSCGEKRPLAKLTNEQVRTIRSQTTRTHRDLAKEFGVSSTTISLILAGKRWTR